MSSFVSKVKGTTSRLFPKKPKEDISESIYKNSLDSQLFFKFQRSSLQFKSPNSKINSSSHITFKEELELNKFRELIVENRKNLDASWTYLDPLKEPDYEEILRIREERIAKAKENNQNLVEKPSLEIKKKKKKDKRKIPLLNNWEVSDDALERSLLPKLKKAKINNLIVLSDDAYTRQLVGYRKLIVILEDNKIPFLEYTNIQPTLTRESANKLISFCNQHKTNSLLVVGSNSLIDFSKLIMRRLIKPKSLRMQSNTSRPVVSSYYSMFSLPTLIIPSTKSLEQPILENKPILKNKNYFDNSIFLFNPIDSSDFVAYLPSFILEYKKTKQQELLHLLFFRLIFSYFDSELTTEDRMRLIRELKSIEWYLNYLIESPSLSLIDAKIIMGIAAKCFDGRYFMTKSSYWTWFKLAANLTKLTQIEFYKSLALFFPSFLEYISINDKEGHDRALELSYLMFGLASTEGLVLQIIKHIKKFGLPQKFYDIPTLKNLNSKFMNQLVKQSSPFLTSYKMTKTIIQNLAVW
ncbi:alcohol dehydrogenase [Mycoplasma ovis str. Michigan]|uniref:Alcohol dehydrogenase n=1 Tax=Mycoplasma ovis str. Michigan TaxID=1415773 RepID=A0ABM5P143_9MOLU|nr:alcohol dehydrogenase [Mycoplasma ovis]AHC40036.1 alcohol dehydrogenase [Mycoplasma ovis str. Michigan]